jgi:segregation and condensation protein A
MAPHPHPGPAPPVWEDPPRSQASSPILAVDGFEGPLDWLLAMARSRRIDLARLSILALVEAFAGAMETALRRAPDAPAPDLARWATWTVMAAQLTELRSRLLRPAGAPEARTAQAEAEALRRHWVLRTQTAAAADWLERRPQLGREVFARGRPEAGQGAWPAGARVGHDTEDGPTQDAAAAAVHTRDSEPVEGGDITDLLRACLVALRLPPHAEADPPRRQPFWSISDAAHRITQLLETGPDGAELGVFLPKIAEAGADHALHARAAVAATLAAALELSRSGALTLQQETPWQPIRVQRQDGGASDTPPGPDEKDDPALA